ncbi:MAG: ABC transporter permease [Microthrixaceae bacterium]
MSARGGDDRPALGTLDAIRIVAGREIGERLRAKSFYVLTGLLVVIILGIGVIGRFADSSPSEIDLGIVGPDDTDLAVAVEQTAASVDREVTITEYSDRGAAEAAIDDGELTLAVVPADGELVTADDTGVDAVALVQQAWASADVGTALRDAGLSEQEAAQALTTAPLEVVAVDGGSDDTGLAILVGTMTAVLLFVSLQTFGSYVLTGVVEEKSTAVVEVLLVRVRADQLLAGKVIGIGVAALVQFAIAIVAGLVALAVSGTEVPSAIWSSLPITLVWFLGGYALYSTLFALAGSLVSRQEDAQAASAPIMTALVAAYMLVFFFGYVPESPASRIMSIIPPIAPFLMPMRMAAGAASVLEVVVSMLGLLAATVGTWKIAGRIYEQVLLRRGSRISWRDALSLGRSSS